MLLTRVEEQALKVCRANLDKLGADSGSYLASVALYEFFGGSKGGYHIMKAACNSGDHHWVVNDLGAVLDPTKENLSGEKPPYRFGSRVSKRNTVVKHLPLLEAIKVELEEADNKSSVDIFGRPLVVEKGGALTDDQQEKLTSAWRALVGDWASSPEEFIRCTFPKGALAVQFVRALLYGEEISRSATMAYTWDRYYVAGSVYPYSEMLPAALEKPNILRGMRFALDGEISFNKLIGTANLPIGGHRMPLDFPIGLAKGLINKYCPPGGLMLDPCHGWGGRLVGFMLSHASSYVGVDPAPHSPKLQEMFDDLSVYLFEPKKLKLINKPFEDVGLRQAAYDFALTSPPYYNIEKYQGEESSWRRYKTLDDWLDGFYRELIAGVADALKPGAYFVLQVTPKLRMVEVAKEIAPAVDLEYVRVHDTAMRRYNSASADSKSASTDTFEVFIVLQKRGK